VHAFYTNKPYDTPWLQEEGPWANMKYRKKKDQHQGVNPPGTADRRFRPFSYKGAGGSDVNALLKNTRSMLGDWIENKKNLGRAGKLTIDMAMVRPREAFEADKIKMMCFLKRYLKRPAKTPAWR